MNLVPLRNPAFVGKAVGMAALLGALAWLFAGEFFPGNGALYDAIAAGDTAEVQQLLASGADPNDRSQGFATPASLAQRGAYSPLVYALREDKADIALLLVFAGADVNARDRDGGTALWLARTQNMPRVVDALRAKRAVCEAPGRKACGGD